MPGHRISHLPVAQFCGQAPTLSERYGAGRAAVMSSFFHATCAFAPEAKELALQLTPEEHEEVGSWHSPKTIQLYDGEVTLDYESADKEMEVMLDDRGAYTEVADKAITIGHLDFAWLRHFRGRNVVFVADIKKSKWTVSGPDSLQIMTYGWSYAQKVGAEAFVPGIWAAQEGEWIWGDWFDMTDLDSLDLWQRIRFAATNTGEANTGPHCRNCYARMHCPEYLFPEHSRMGALAAFAEGREPTPVEVADAYLSAQAMEDMAKRIKDNAKEWARRGNEIIAADGRRLIMSERAGRAVFDVKGLKAVHPELAEQFVTRGEPYVVPMWK